MIPGQTRLTLTPSSAPFQPQGVGETDHRPFAGAVGNFLGHRDQAGQRTDVDDLPPALLDHLAIGGDRPVDNPHQVDVHHGAPLFDAKVTGLAEQGGTGVVEDQIDPTVLSHHILDDTLGVLVDGHIQIGGESLAAGLPDDWQTASAPSWSTSTATTVAPRRPSSRQSARPSPEAPPVTTAILS